MASGGTGTEPGRRVSGRTSLAAASTVSSPHAARAPPADAAANVSTSVPWWAASAAVLPSVRVRGGGTGGGGGRWRPNVVEGVRMACRDA